MNNCFSAPTAEPPQWGKGASNYSGVGIFKFLFLKRRAMLVPWGAVRVGLGWGLEVSFGLPGFCVCVCVGGGCLFLSLLARWGPAQGRCHRWLGLSPAAGTVAGKLGGTCEGKGGLGSLELPPSCRTVGLGCLWPGCRLPCHPFRGPWGIVGDGRGQVSPVPARFLPSPWSHSAHGLSQDFGKSDCLPTGPLAFEVQACFLPPSVGI